MGDRRPNATWSVFGGWITNPKNVVLPPKIGIVVTQNMDLTIEQLEFHDFTNKRIDMNWLLNQQQLGFNHPKFIYVLVFGRFALRE